MGFITIGVVVVAIFLLFLGLYFWASGAVVIDEDEREIIDAQNPKDVENEMKEVKKEDTEEVRREERDPYSR